MARWTLARVYGARTQSLLGDAFAGARSDLDAHWAAASDIGGGEASTEPDQLLPRRKTNAGDEEKR